MLVFVILMQIVVILSGFGKESTSGKEEALSREEFSQQLKERQQALKILVEENKALAVNLGFISLFILIALILGAVFFIDYVMGKKRDNFERIPRTLDAPKASWGLGDVFRIIILFLFFSHFFSVYSYMITNLFSQSSFDRRADITISTGFMDILIFMFVLRFVIVKRHQNLKALGISAKSILKNIGIAIYSYIGFLPVLAVIFLAVMGAAKIFNYTPPPEAIYELIFKEQRPFLLIIISVLISLIGPIVEEVFFRGFLYGALRKSFGISRAILFSAIFFSLLHTNVLGFIPIVALGMFLAYLREKTGSLVPSITVHIIHNTALASLMFFIRGLTSNVV